jgi:hypothetical protein
MICVCLPAAVFCSVWFMFAGFFLPYSAMPAWWSWLYWINPLSYMLYGIIASQLGDVTSTIVLGPGQATTVQLLLKGEPQLGGRCCNMAQSSVVTFGSCELYRLSLCCCSNLFANFHEQVYTPHAALRLWYTTPPPHLLLLLLLLLLCRLAWL